MSCQQLIQEDPYIFTDTVSNSASFMHENNSQAKYVPLNRQTIYNRQFRQHEPKLASLSDSNNSTLKSTAYADHHNNSNKNNSSNNKIVISPTTTIAAPTFKERKHLTDEPKNGKRTLTNTKKSSSSPRTSPKFFKSHQQQPHEHSNKDDDSTYNNSINSTNHSNINSTVSKKSNKSTHHEHQQQCKTILVNHVAEALQHCITGIKKEEKEQSDGDDDDEDDMTISRCNVIADNLNNKIKVIKDEVRIKTEKCDGDYFVDISKKFMRRSGKAHVIVEPVSDVVVPRYDAPLVQLNLNVIDKRLCQNYGGSGSRDERLSMRKMLLRHVFNQYKGINRFREISTERFKSQISKSFKFCKMMEREKQRILKKSVKTCSTRDCKDLAMFASNYCTKHILSSEKEQFLIRQCCFRYADGQQCRVPVSNVLETIPACQNHQNAAVHQLISSDSIEPKKNPVQRKRTKTRSPLIRPVKKNGKGRKKKSSIAQSNIMLARRPTTIIHPNDLQKETTRNNGSMQLKQQDDSNQFIHFNSGNLLASSQSSYGSMSSGNEDLYIKQDLMPAACENSYESSEDTGVGGLSENELISHDAIGNFDMESCAELSKVLSSLPSNTLDDLLTEPLHTSLHASRDDEDGYLDRAIEEVSASGMDQIAITAFEHLEGLDMLELDDQMINAATNLISMSNYLSHDQDMISMPSPMMS